MERQLVSLKVAPQKWRPHGPERFPSAAPQSEGVLQGELAPGHQGELKSYRFHVLRRWP